MKERAYKLYSKFFGHPKLFNVIINKFSDSSINISESATLGRGSELYGNIEIGKNVSIKKDVKIMGDVNIGDHTGLMGNNSIIGEVSIGKYCPIAARARMRTLDHPTYKPSMSMGFYNKIGSELPHISKGPIKIENDVWIGSDTKILSDVTIENGAVIAADSVVVDDVKPYSIVAGNPATHKGYRFDESTREALQEIAWWDWDEERQKKNIEFFESDLRETSDIYSLIE
ncbi:CatB-related O-acetyltransferase [Natronomonas salsuginis]|uniref:Antibiotic acetyltransferase n=1 Tax=Natronomonas salsuginis TaxID=2217661 RepID=A0A4V5ZNI6_9EURY|nr:CatB-related O-acetyltransferase [Natronomonas salsuginis]TKR25243.1 antibiotic acetyltransferase [Natronomonas salsuginis]